MFFPQIFSSTNNTHVGTGNGSDWSGGWISSMSRQSAAGIQVNTETALGLSALRACVTLLAESVAQLPCELYKRQGDDGRKKAINHPLYDLVRYQPNQMHTSFEYFEQGQGSLGLEGNHYALISRNSSGIIEELLPVNPKKIQVLKGNDGLPYYRLNGEENLLSMRDVHHIRAFSLNGYIGLSPIQTNPDNIGLALATEHHASAVFKRGATMSGVIEAPSDAPTIKTQAGVDKLVDGFINRHGGGLRNAFSVAFLQEGMQYKQLAMDNEKAQLLQSRGFGVTEICRLYKIPAHMIQHTEKSTSWGSGIEQLSLAFVIYTLLPWLKRTEAAMMRDLLTPKERKKYYLEFNISSLLRGDQKARYEAYAIGRNWGWLSVNDVRRMENMPPITGGDKYLTPLNMTDANVQALNGTPEQLEAALRVAEASPEQLNQIQEILCH